MLLNACAGPRLEPLYRVAGLRDADDRDIKMPPFDHRQERGEDLLVGEITRGPKEDEGVGGSLLIMGCPSLAWAG